MYRHSQVGTLMLLLMGGIAIAALVVLLSVGPNVSLAVCAFFVVLAALFWRLVVEVDSHAIRLTFGIGLIRRTIPVAEVAAAAPVKNTWLYGWGIRLTPHGWMWNISGLDAVELTYRSGKRFRIGTDEPEKLARVIRRAAGLPEESP
jgi:hypothetical protein